MAMFKILWLGTSMRSFHVVEHIGAHSRCGADFVVDLINDRPSIA